MSRSDRSLPAERMNRHVWPLAVALLLIISVIASGCGQNEPVESAEPDGMQSRMDEPAEPEPLPEPEPEPELPVYPFVYPLTGIGTEDEAATKQRPIVVMIENSPRARPQDGLHKADIVYEILAEGDITRFVAVFHSQAADVIGPVRSIRPYLAQLGHYFDGLIVHAGWSQEGINYIKKHNLAHFDQVYGDDAYYWRDHSRKAPHNLYTKSELIREGAVNKKYREQWNAVSPKFVQSSEAAVIAGQPAASIRIPYIGKYYVSYEYDPLTGRYDRLMLGEPHKDKASDTQLTADNIMVIFAKHRIVDAVGRRHIDVTGPGSGYLIQRGQIREVEWNTTNGMISPYIDGKEVELLPGQTWVQIVPEGVKVEYQ